MNRAQIYHNMTTAELNEKYTSLKSELLNLRFQHTSGQVQNTDQLRVVRNDIARVLTVLKERETGAKKNPGKKKQTTAGGKK